MGPPINVRAGARTSLAIAGACGLAGGAGEWLVGAAAGGNERPTGNGKLLGMRTARTCNDRTKGASPDVPTHEGNLERMPVATLTAT